jgi:hypothetical protein
VRLPDRLKLRVLAAELFQFGRIPRGGRVGEEPGDLLRPRERLAESGLHELARSGLGPVLLAETLDATGRIEELLLAREEGMAIAADFNVNHRHSRARDKRIAARALDGRPLVFGVNPGFHCSILAELSDRKKCGNIAGALTWGQGSPQRFD